MIAILAAEHGDKGHHVEQMATVDPTTLLGALIACIVVVIVVGGISLIALANVGESVNHEQERNRLAFGRYVPHADVVHPEIT